MLISVKSLVKYVIRIYALGSAHEKGRRLNQSRPKVVLKSKFPAGLGEKNG